MSGSKKGSKKSNTKLQTHKVMHSTGKKRAIARRKHRRLRVVVEKQTS